MRPNLLLIILALLLAFCGPAHSKPNETVSQQGENCLGQAGPRIFLSQAMLGRINPKQLAHIFMFTYCRPLFRKPGILYSLTNFSAGAITYLSPVLNGYGASVSVTPLSFITFRLDALFVHHWSLPGLKGTGFYPLPSYDTPYDDKSLEKREGRQSSSFLLQGKITVRGRVDAGKYVRFALLNDFWIDFWRLDQNVFSKNIPRDVVLAQTDVVLVNTLHLFVEFRIRPDISFLAGAQHEWTYVPQHPYHSHMFAGLLVVTVAKIGRIVKNLRGFIQMGSYVKHAFRTGKFYSGAGLAVDYDLGPI